jgi:predicted phage-related endonuclease
MIEVNRFIVRSSDREQWLFARSQGVTATMVAGASTPSGFREVIENIDNPKEIIPNAMMEWGNTREPFVAMELKERFAEYGLMPNDWLIAKDAGLNRWQMATPDMLSLDHNTIGEIKTSGKPLDKVPLGYMRQIQWQLYVTDAERCLFAYEQRLQGPNGFVPSLDVKSQWIERDEEMIKGLILVAEQVQQHQVYKSWDEREQMENENG